MEIKHLRAFVAVAEQRSFSRAAAALYISQPTLSYQIGELENELCERLFDRNSRNVSLTDVGTAILAEARRIVDAADDMKIRVKSGMFHTKGKIRLRLSFEKNLAIVDSTGIARRLIEFADARPDIVVETLDIPFEECAAALLAERVDACVMVFNDRRAVDPGLESKLLFRDNACLVYSSDFGALSCEEVVEKLGFFHVVNRNTENAQVMRCLSELGLEPKIERVGNRQTALICASMGKCFAGLAEKQFEAMGIPGLSAARIELPNAEITHRLVWRKGDSEPALRSFVAFM